MKITAKDIKLGLEEKGKKWFPTYKGVTFYDEEDINQRLSELLNILEEPIIFNAPPTIDYDKKWIYKVGFRDGEEAHKKKTREVFTK